MWLIIIILNSLKRTEKAMGIEVYKKSEIGALGNLVILMKVYIKFRVS